jgi:hypothetical protein
MLEMTGGITSGNSVGVAFDYLEKAVAVFQVYIQKDEGSFDSMGDFNYDETNPKETSYA